MSFWLCVTDERNWNIIKKEKIWGVTERHSDKIHSTEKGDRFVFYVKPKRIGGIFEVKSESYNDDEGIFTGKTYPHRVKIEPLLVSDEFLDFGPLVPEMHFIKKKRVWGGYLQGKAMRLIPKEDFELIKEKLKSVCLEGD